MNAPIQPTLMLPRDMQLANEHTFSRKHIDGYLAKELEQSSDYHEAVAQGVQLLQQWLNQEHYVSKQARLDQLRELDLTELVSRILRATAYVRRPELFTSVSAQLAGELGFSDKPAAIATMAEVLAVVCETDAYDIFKESTQASLMLVSNIPLSEQLQRYVQNSRFLPPMVCEPNLVEHNRMSGYLTHNDSLVLGKGNHHDGDLCLDVINLQNSIPLQLNQEFLLANELQPNFEIVSAEQDEQWRQFKQQSQELWLLMLQQGNRFWLTHKVDKRGRLYSVGYHINTQGNQFQKAMIELADEELVGGCV